MAASAAQVLYVLTRLKEKIKNAKVIRQVKYNEKEVKSFALEDFDLNIDKLEISMKFTPEGSSQEMNVSALHYFRSNQEDVVKVNGESTTDDDVDMDVDLHLLRADVEYRMKCKQSGTQHKIFMLATVDWCA